MLIDFTSTLQPFYAADGGAGDTSGDEPEPGEVGRKVKSSDVLERYGGQTAQAALRMAEKLADAENANYKLRRVRDDLAAERDALRKTAAPEGAIVLTPDQARLWESYQGLGKPEELTAALKDRDAAQGELTTLRRGASLTAAADAHGYKAAALGKLPSLAGKEVVVKDVTEGEATVKRAFVKDGDKETSLPDYIALHDPELLPALSADQQNGQQTGSGTRYPAQSSSTQQRAQGANAAKSYIKATPYALPKKG